jgi:TorA maturation chaperone TorD
MENEEFQLLMKARKNVYDLLRCFFLQEPSEEFLRALRDDNILNKLSGGNEELDEGIELLSSALSSPDLSGLASSLREEFTRLFVGPLPIPLYESVYRSASGLVKQEETDAVRDKYLEAGLLIHPESSFPEDHIGAEIEFLYFLADKAAAAEEKEAQNTLFLFQQEFLRDHLSRWVGLFCDRLFSSARSPFFRGAAKITKGFVAWDLGELMADLGG